MDLIDRLRAISNRIPKLLPKLETEEATKNALIMPMVQALGYDVFDPDDVVPEYNADVGTKKGEKVDYALMQDGEPAILIEAKAAHVALDGQHATQLFRYFSVTKARVAILTNGVEYRLYSDIDEPNKMDEKPFMVLDMREVRESWIPELKRLTKSSFDVDAVVDAASELKYLRLLKAEVAAQFDDPGEELVRLLAKRVYDGNLTAAQRERFAHLTKRALNSFLNDHITGSIRTVLREEQESQRAAEEEEVARLPEGVVAMDGDIVTTVDEVKGYEIVRTILGEVVDPERVAMRDTKSYCGVLLDDNNRKPICRLRFNSKQWYLGLFDEEKNETRVAIGCLADISKHGAALRDTAARYDVE
jgi:hypothetical protein